MASGKRVAFAWELGNNTGHVAKLMPLAVAMQARGHEVRFLLRDVRAGSDFPGASAIPREAAPIWYGTPRNMQPLNFGEILLNFGYGSPASLGPLVDAWRERLAGTHLVCSSAAPAAHLAARTLGIASFEPSQGFDAPPAVFPSPPLRDWEPAPRERLEAADRCVLDAMNAVLGAHGAAPLATLGELYAGRALLQTYPELDIYPQRGPAEYYGILEGGEGSATPAWPEAKGGRAVAYLYASFPHVEPLLAALRAADVATLVLCRGVTASLEASHADGPVRFVDAPMALSEVLPQCDFVACHGSHGMTAISFLAGRPMLLLPTQLEQFLITRRVVRYGAALGAMSVADFGAAIKELRGNPKYAQRARTFAQRYAGHDRKAALEAMIARCEAAMQS